MSSHYSGYWVFFSNPQNWFIDDFLFEQPIGTEFTWSLPSNDLICKKQLNEGQYGVIRVGKDNRSIKELKSEKTRSQLRSIPRERLEQGIYAIVRVKSQAYEMAESHSQYNRELKEGEIWRVKIELVRNLISSPMLKATIKDDISGVTKRVQRSILSIEKSAFDLIVQFSDKQLISELDKFERNCSNKTPEEKMKTSKVIERGPIGNAVKEYNKFECQICKGLNQECLGFRKPNGSYYVEAHHVIPVSTRAEGCLSELNIITVCPNHHRQLHYGKTQVIQDTESFFEFEIDDRTVKINKVKHDNLSLKLA